MPMIVGPHESRLESRGWVTLHRLVRGSAASGFVRQPSREVMTEELLFNSKNMRLRVAITAELTGSDAKGGLLAHASSMTEASCPVQRFVGRHFAKTFDWADVTGEMPFRGGSVSGVWISQASPNRSSIRINSNPMSSCPG